MSRQSNTVIITPESLCKVAKRANKTKVRTAHEISKTKAIEEEQKRAELLAQQKKNAVECIDKKMLAEAARGEFGITYELGDGYNPALRDFCSSGMLHSGLLW